MKHLTIGKKVSLGFFAVVILLVIVGLVSYNALNNASEGFGGYREMARDANLAGLLEADMLMVRMNVKDFIITGSEKDLQEYEEHLKQMHDFLETAKEKIQNPARAKKIAFVDKEVEEYQLAFAKVVEFKKQRNHMFYDILNIDGPKMEKNLTAIMTSAEKDKDIEAAFHAGLALRSLLLARLYVVKFIDSNSQADAGRVEAEFEQLDAELDKLEKHLQNAERREWLQQVEEADHEYHETFEELVNLIFERNKIISETLDRIGPEIAGAVQEVKLDIKAVQDELGPKLVASSHRAELIIGLIGAFAVVLGVLLAVFITRGMSKALKRIIAGLTESAVQVGSASDQISSSSQVLSEGASEQAASLEETASSLEEIASMTRQNAENAAQADTLVRDTNQVVNEANLSMQELTTSMVAITEASEETQKIVKTIDEIAFQTNLLALNAAVEAARAGEAGAGFAVVADEVRNLAIRAADAAKNTAGLIDGTVKKIQDGSELVSKTNAAFGKVSTSSLTVGELVAEISTASKEQADGIEQVARTVNEMDKVVQQNAANAEENASASEEMNAQADQIKFFVGGLVDIVGGSSDNGTPSQKAGPAAMVPVSEPIAVEANQPPKPRQRSAKNPGRAMRPENVIPLEDDFQDF